MRKNLDGGLLHAMRAFLRVIDSGSFTAAAEQMELTTAQVSRLISDLEKRLNAKLLQRTTRQRALTDIGADYAERCREVTGCDALMIGRGMVTDPGLALAIKGQGDVPWSEITPLLSVYWQQVSGRVERRHRAGRLKQWLN